AMSMLPEIKSLIYDAVRLEGCRGDLVLVPARTLAEAVALTPQKRTVIRRGQVVARDGMLCGGPQHIG
ncbi:MAG: hypothetical protein QM684_14865, partial [Rhizobium sp.]